MTVLPQVLVNVKVKDEFKITYKDIPEISEKIKEIENQLGESGRVLIRPSGTEPLIRVMIEGENEDDIGVMANDLANLIGEHCKK